MSEEFKHCRMEIGKDAQGKEILLKDKQFQVMMEWERPYMHACIDALKPFGDVLEIGFGLGYSATRIQSYQPKSHTIIEYHPTIAAYARNWAKNYPNVTIIEETWQNALPKLPVYDAIFFDDYPLYDEKEMHAMQEQTAQSNLLLQQGQTLLQHVAQELPFLQQIQYKDTDLQELFTAAPPHTKQEALQMIRFLQDLSAKGQITSVQLENFTRKCALLANLTHEEQSALKPSSQKQGVFDFRGPNDRLYTFLSHCLKSHMRNGARFSCFLSSPESKYEDPKFFNEIITNPYLDYHEEEMEIEVPANCDYYHGGKALVITIAKRSG